MADELIETPYGHKTPALLCKAMDAHTALPALLEAVRQARDELRSHPDIDRGNSKVHFVHCRLCSVVALLTELTS